MATVKVGDRTFTVRNISINNGRITMDGQDITIEEKQITFNITGDLDKLEVDACDKVTVVGNVSSLKTMSGDVDVQGSVTGSISTMSGDVDCGNVGGNVSTMSGDIRKKN